MFVIEFLPGDLVEETVNNEVVAYYIILTRHYLDGFPSNPMLGYYFGSNNVATWTSDPNK